MLALSRTERRAVGGAALAAFVTAFAGVPGQAISRPVPVGPPLVRAQRPASVPTDVLPNRDPFAPRIAETAPASSASAALRLAPLPPNARAGAFPFAATTPAPIRLLAVVSGPQPGALVDDRGTSRFVVRGDRVAQARIASIDADGIVLADGRRITLARSRLEDRR